MQQFQIPQVPQIKPFYLRPQIKAKGEERAAVPNAPLTLTPPPVLDEVEKTIDWTSDLITLTDTEKQTLIERGYGTKFDKVLRAKIAYYKAEGDFKKAALESQKKYGKDAYGKDTILTLSNLLGWATRANFKDKSG
jgi:hypothetical protein